MHIKLICFQYHTIIKYIKIKIIHLIFLIKSKQTYVIYKSSVDTEELIIY